MLQAMLRACDQAELERKLDELQVTLAARSGPGRGGGRQPRKLNRLLLAKALTGKEVARLALQNYVDERTGKIPTFSGEVGGSRTGEGDAPGTAQGGGQLQRLDRRCPDRRLYQPGSHREGA